jgi:hypothetical protein
MKKRLIALIVIAMLQACGGGASVAVPTNTATSLDPFMKKWVATETGSVCNRTNYHDIQSYKYGYYAQFVGLNFFLTHIFYTDSQCTQAKYQIVESFYVTWGQVIPTSYSDALEMSVGFSSAGVYSYSGFDGSGLNPYTVIDSSWTSDIIGVAAVYQGDLYIWNFNAPDYVPAN